MYTMTLQLLMRLLQVDVHLVVMVSAWPGAVHPSISLSLVSHRCRHNLISLFTTPTVLLLIRLLLQCLLFRKADT